MNERIVKTWSQALSGDVAAQSQWPSVDGGDWAWEAGGVRVKGTGPEWLALSCLPWDAECARGQKNFLIELTVSGKAEAAGLSFGGYKDFLIRVDTHTGPRRLQLEVDVDADCWAFRVDGRLMERCWWDTAITGVEEILRGQLRLKVRNAGEVLFRDLTFHKLESPCLVSVIITCSRFLQRLRVSLRNWCHQELPSGTHELLIVNPQSPDGTHEHLAAVARSYPHVRVREIAVGNQLVKNKGAMINRAFASSRGEWIWLTDADCVFGPHSAAAVLRQIRSRHDHLYYGERRFLTPAQTDALLSGRTDALRDFAALTAGALSRPPERHHWGYTQIVHRSVFQRVRYSERHNHFAHTDGMFVEACRREGAPPLPVEGLFCLHLDHPFSWYGAESFL